MEQQSRQSGESVEEIIKKYADMVYRLAFAKVGNQYDAEEIFQEVFLSYVKNYPTFNEEEHEKAWLIRVTVNCANRFWRKAFRRREQHLKDGSDEEDVMSVSHTAETEREIDLHRELQKLPKKYREVIHLFYYEDMSLEEISSVLNRKNPTVRSQLRRARAMLKEFMKEEDYV